MIVANGHIGDITAGVDGEGAELHWEVSHFPPSSEACAVIVVRGFSSLSTASSPSSASRAQASHLSDEDISGTAGVNASPEGDRSGSHGTNESPSEVLANKLRTIPFLVPFITRTLTAKVFASPGFGENEKCRSP